MAAPAPFPAPVQAAPAARHAERDARLAAWLQAAAQGDSQAFEAFYEATAAVARALARRIVASADLEDLLADAFFEAWRHAARFDAARGSAMTWLLTLVRSRALDLLRHQAARPDSLGDEDLLAQAADPAPDPAEQLWRAQAGTRLHAALQALTAPERWVLGLAFFRELSHAEIAAQTGLPLGTVKSHALRAQSKLRAALAE